MKTMDESSVLTSHGNYIPCGSYRDSDKGISVDFRGLSVLNIRGLVVGKGTFAWRYRATDARVRELVFKSPAISRGWVLAACSSRFDASEIEVQVNGRAVAVTALS